MHCVSTRQEKEQPYNETNSIAFPCLQLVLASVRYQNVRGPIWHVTKASQAKRKIDALAALIICPTLQGAAAQTYSV